MANGRDVTFRSCLSHQAGAFRGNAVQKMRNESTRENHTQRLKVSCLSATVEKCEVGGSHKLAECSKNLWKETTKSLRDMRSILVMKCHMTQHASRSSVCGGGGGVAISLQPVAKELLKQMPPHCTDASLPH